MRTVYKSQGNRAPPECRCPPTASPGHPNTARAQEEELKYNLMKMIEPLKRKWNQSLKEVQENPNKQGKEIKLFKT